MVKEEKGDSFIKRLFAHPATGPYLALLILVIVATIASPIFFTTTNIANVFRQASIVGVVSIGMTVVLLVGGIDLSVSYIMAICACISSRMFETMVDNGNEGIGIHVVLVILGIGVAVGLVNGILICARNVEPFIITLGVGQVIKGITYLYTGGSPGGTVTEFWKNFGSEFFLDLIPYPVILYAALMVIFMIVLHKTVYGRRVYAVGSNADAARLSGIRVTRDKIIAYILCGVTAAIAGLMLCARVRVGEPGGSSGYDMDSIAAVVIGGTAMSGGRGYLICTLAGVLIMAIMNNMLTLIGADPNLQMVIKGLVILVAVLIQKKES